MFQINYNMNNYSPMCFIWSQVSPKKNPSKIFSGCQLYSNGGMANMACRVDMRSRLAILAIRVLCSNGGMANIACLDSISTQYLFRCRVVMRSRLAILAIRVLYSNGGMANMACLDSISTKYLYF